MPKSIHERTENLFNEVGEFGYYQFLVFFLVGLVSVIPGIVGYSYSFYGATPNFRCKIPDYQNDTYEIQNDYHQGLIDTYIPLSLDNSFKGIYDRCNIKSYQNRSNFTIDQCSEWVYSKQYFESTLISQWNLVCQNSSKKNIFSTLYFVGTYGVILSGILSDRFGRKKATYAFIIANSLLNILLAVLISVDMNPELQQALFALLRLLTGIASNVYSLAAVLAMEIVGTSKRVTAVNTIYYIFIAGEFIVLFFAYFFRNYRIFYSLCTIFMTTFVFYFWVVPESPRWLMTKKQFQRAYEVFKRIAKSNKRKLDELVELDELKQQSGLRLKKTQVENIQLTEKLNEPEQLPEKNFSFYGTIKIFFKSRKLLVRSISILINWLTNTLVYYGISFNTSDLAGDPFLNFGLSILVELAAILVTHVTLERFGRKIPYAVNMGLTGLILLSVMFIPPDMAWLVTTCALIGKFSISFTYNTIYIITGESHPTVIRNSVISICQSFARLGAIIAPNIQYLGELFWFPIPFVVYGSFSTVSAISFILFVPETKFTKLPDTIEEFVIEI